MYQNQIMIKDIVIFLRKPDPLMFHYLNAWVRIKRTVLIFLILILLQVSVQIIFLILGNSDNENSIAKYNETASAKLSPLYIILFAPFLEELTFRLPLTKFNILFVRISCSLMIGLLISSVLNRLVAINAETILVRVLISLGVYVIFLISKVNFEFLMHRWEKVFKSIVWASMGIFIAIHIPQLIGADFNSGSFVRSVISLLLSAFMFSYVRTRHGFVYSLSLHSFYNLLSVYVT